MPRPPLMSDVRPAASARDSILAAIETVGDAWSWLILREAVLHRVQRFGEFQERLGISRATLTARLNQLDRGAVLVRDPAAPRRYTLTEAGEDFFGCLMVAQHWGERWRPSSGAALSITHRELGHRVSAVLCCVACGVPLRAHDVHAERPAESIAVAQQDARWRAPDLGLLERARPCSIAHAMAVAGDRWSFLIHREIFFGVHRFDELQRRLGVGPNVLSTRLRRSISLGMLRKVEYQEWPVRHEYRLTDKGLDYYPIPLSLGMWGRRWLTPAPGEPRLTHTCGAEVQAKLCCEQCDQEITRADVDVAAPV